MRARLFLTLSALALTALLPLAACDDGKGDQAAAEVPNGDDALPEVAQAGTGEPPLSTMPAAPVADTVPPATSDEGSTGEASPGGEAVTETELPQSDVPPPARETFTDASCEFEEWIGKPVDDAAIKATGRPSRILTPDSVMTMDHNPERINVVHGEDGKVTRVWCG